MHHLGGGHRLAQDAAARVQHEDTARMVVVEPVRFPLPNHVELHALDNVPLPCHRPRHVEEVSFQDLQLERHAEVIRQQPRPEPDDPVAALGGGPHDERLHAVEIQLPAGIAVLREERPLPVDELVERGASGLGLGNDPGPTALPTSSVMALLAYGLLRSRSRERLRKLIRDAPTSVLASPPAATQPSVRRPDFAPSYASVCVARRNCARRYARSGEK